MRKIFAILCCIAFIVNTKAQDKVVPQGDDFRISEAVIYCDPADWKLVHISARLLQQDIGRITGTEPPIIHQLNPSQSTVIAIGSIDKATGIKQLTSKIPAQLNRIRNQWEAYHLQLIRQKQQQVLLICGSDRRGTAYGVMELSKLLGVSPWYWWADVPVQINTTITLPRSLNITSSPKVKYRGIFINDEAPAFSGWAKEKFGGINHLAYEKIFELMLRLKANYLWPAMWGNAFYDDDSLNRQTADNWGIVIGTSHHEPLMRAHDEWRRYGKGKWNYDSNAAVLQDFWKKGMQRATNEKVVTIGMRGDGDEPMSRETATALLERIVADQRNIIQEVTGKPATATPQIWALYKEVQDYYDQGMRVPDDATLLLCDDNWGNIRRLPRPGERKRKGGYGIYYHFDYVGGPRNYKWINTNPLPRIWEQMHLAWVYDARQMWIVNVGDIKPMELPISFFLDYAWNPEDHKDPDLQPYTENWYTQQFGNTYAKRIAAIMSRHYKFMGRRKPELLDAGTYFHHYREWEQAAWEYQALQQEAEQIAVMLPGNVQDAYFQLVFHPVKAAATLYNLYYAVSRNQYYAEQKDTTRTNRYAAEARAYYTTDSLLSIQYNTKISGGKWNHMMDQVHIGYTGWQQPGSNRMPAVITFDQPSSPQQVKDTVAPAGWTKPRHNSFRERDGYISIEAAHFSKSAAVNGLSWTILPGHGRTGDAVTVFPVTMKEQDINEAPELLYEWEGPSTGNIEVQLYFSPTLNLFNNGGLKYSVSVDNEKPSLFTLNADDNKVRTWETWVAGNIIIKTSAHQLSGPGKHILRYRQLSPAIVLQKIVINTGGLQPSYLGPPESN